jgi:hypothetical protein
MAIKFSLAGWLIRIAMDMPVATTAVLAVLSLLVILASAAAIGKTLSKERSS